MFFIAYLQIRQISELVELVFNINMKSNEMSVEEKEVKDWKTQ